MYEYIQQSVRAARLTVKIGTTVDTLQVAFI